MTYCHVSRQIDEYAHGEMVADAFNDALNKRIENLTKEGAEYYPFSRENMKEALGALSDNQELILQHSLENGINEIGLMIGNWVTQYCELQAEKEAIKELSE